MAGFKKVAVLGLGTVGSLVGVLLKEAGFSVSGYDQAPKDDLGFAAKKLDVSNASALEKELASAEAVVSCLPYALNIKVAEIAHKLGIHYFDLTEDVKVTRRVKELSKTAKAAMAPQCGLAPGIVGIVAAHLAKDFKTPLRKITLRVGALPLHPQGQLGYAINWSPNGLINQCLNPCEVIRNGKAMEVPPLEDLEDIRIDGLHLEAFTTSGGLGTMTETWLGKVDELNYKTMRYPGHCKAMRLIMHELRLGKDRELLGKILGNALPPSDEDVVFLHSAVEGEKDGQLQSVSYVRRWPAIGIAGKRWKAISWTTAASVCAVVEMIAKGDLPSKGFIAQESIPFDKYLKTKSGKHFK